MTSILTLAGRCFAVLAVTIGLSFYGCMDIASVNPVAELASLTVTPGTLQPAFTSGTTQYTVDLTRDVTSVRITAQPAVAGDTITINGQTTTSSTIALGPEGSTTSVSIVVSESTNNSRTYIVLLKRASLAGNNSLASLAVSPGTLAPQFTANELNYSVDVANDVESVTVTPTLQDSAATMKVNGQARNSGEGQPPIQLGGTGSSTTIEIVVTAQNNSEKTYRVTVNRGKSGNNFLESLAVSRGTLDPLFNSSILGYTVNLPSILPGNPPSMTVMPTSQDSTASMTVNGQPATSGQAQTTPLPAPGSSTFITIVVTAQNNTQRTYTVNVIRAALGGNNNLSALSVTSGSLTPVFAEGTLAYMVNVATNVTSVDVSATKSDPNAVISGSLTAAVGVATGQASIPLGGPGTTTPVTITVTAPNGSSKTYNVDVNRLSGDNNLLALSVTPPSSFPPPGFVPSTLAYTVDVATDVTSVDVSATKSDPNAVMAIGSVTVPAGTASGSAPNIPLDGPGTPTPISITVTATNGVPKTYTITVNRAAPSSDNNLSALSVTPPGSFPPPGFVPSTLAYTVDVATDVTEVDVSATKSDPNAVMAIGSVTVPAGTASGSASNIPLNGPGTTTLISITVTASSGVLKTYTITVNRAAAAPPPP